MIKPLWAVAGVALLGTAGVAGALVVASSGGEEEFVQEVETATPSPAGSETLTPAASPVIELPSPSPVTAGCSASAVPPGVRLCRWGDVAVLIPGDTEIRAIGTFMGQDNRPALEISAGGWGRTVIDAATGAILSQEPKGDYAALIDSIVATVTICPFDRSAAPWPYNGDPPSGSRMTIGYVSYFEPDPATGIQVLGGMGCSASTQGGGCHEFLDVRSARSSLSINAETGEVVEQTKKISAADEGAFERFLAEIQVKSP